MPAFAYSARAADGAAESGTLEAAGRREALASLRSRGLRVSELREAGTDPVRRVADAPAPDTSLRLPFLEALDDLVRGGLSAGEAVRLLSQRLQSGPLRALCAHVWAKLGEGQSLSTALATVPTVFDSHTVHLVAAGEATGSLQGVLGRLIQHFTEQAEFRQRLVRAMIYPAVICLVASGVVAFFVLFLLPRLRPLLDSLGGELPLSARILTTLAEATLVLAPMGLVAAGIAWVWISRWRRTESGRMASDTALLRLPLIGSAVTRIAVLNFCETLASLLENGITTAQALRMAEKSAPNRAIRARLRAATDRVLEGESLSRALGRTGVFPPLLLDRITVAEQTGNLAPGLRDVARSYRVQLDRWLGTLANTFSTGVLIAAFGLVALIAFAIVSAVFSVGFRF
jgi:type II secretory pathway component PulF